MSGAIQSKQQLSQFLKNNGIDNKFLDKHLGKINNPVVKGVARMAGVNVDAIVEDVRSCINPETGKEYASYDRRHPANATVYGSIYDKTGSTSKYDNIRYKK